MTRPLSVGVAGLGTVGAGVLRLLREQHVPSLLSPKERQAPLMADHAQTCISRVPPRPSRHADVAWLRPDHTDARPFILPQGRALD